MSAYALRRAGVADRMREMLIGMHARIADAVREEDIRQMAELKWQRQLWTEDAAWMARLESEAVTDEQREFARKWRAEFEARSKQ